MRVLMLTHRLPYAPNKGDRLRAYHMLHALRPEMDIHLLSLVHTSDELSHTSDLRHLTAGVTAVPVSRWSNALRALPALTTERPLTHTLLDAPGLARTAARLVEEVSPDAIFAYGSGMARLAFEPALRDLPLVLDFVDVDSTKWRELGRVSAPPMRWVYTRESRTLGRFEAMAARRADAALVVNEREQAELLGLAPMACVRIVANGVDLESFTRLTPPSERPRVVFCGVMDYAPNVNGALWMARTVWPFIKARRPDATMVIVGANPVADIRRLATDDPSIEVTGTVPSVQPFLWDAAVNVAPLHTARGVQNKVLEGVAAGLPCVMTSAVAHGVPHCVLPACRVADTPESFGSEVMALLSLSGAERQYVVARADLSSLTWAARLAPLAGLIRDAVKNRSGHRETA
jgi:sugar transferase (PEP-CTERM/EpsH1 system associated)